MFTMINYKHLHYFLTVAKEGGVVRASERLHLTPQTISGQLGLLEDTLGIKLFNRVGRHLELTDDGRLVLSYAEEIFSLGSELEEVVNYLPADRPQAFRVGVVDVVPKSIAHRVLEPALQMDEQVRMVCREADLDSLLAELTIHRLDMVLSDRPIPSAISTQGFSHRLGECGVTFLATKPIADQLTGAFPTCLNGMPLLLPSSEHQLRASIDQWLNKHRIQPRIVAEFDDSALMKAFGKEGMGVFLTPSVIRDEVIDQYNVIAIGDVPEVKESFFAISVERKVIHPVSAKILERARERLFSE
jgi:LysR family transcriptional activator of nhaA